MDLAQKSVSWMKQDSSPVNVITKEQFSESEIKLAISDMESTLVSFLQNATSLYDKVPSNELSNIILLLENIERELQKLK